MSTSNIMALVIIALFMLIPLAMGAVAGKKSIPTTEDFFLQGRGMGSVAVFFTVAATWWSAFAFMGSNAYFYLKGPLYWTAIAVHAHLPEPDRVLQARHGVEPPLLRCRGRLCRERLLLSGPDQTHC